jgi:hypothetical protein
MKPGNYAGIGENNKEKKLTIPRFVTFAFGKLDIFSVLESKTRTWKISSYSSFDELEDSLKYQSADRKMIVLVDGEVLDYTVDSQCERDSFGDWMRSVSWQADIFKVFYTEEGIEKEEKFCDRFVLEKYIKDIVRKGAKEIKVFNIIEDKGLGFSVTGTLYNTDDMDDTNTWLIWSKHDPDDLVEDEEEVEEWHF